MKPLINLSRNNKERDKLIEQSLNNQASYDVKLSGKGTLIDRIKNIIDKVRLVFAERFSDDYLITGEDELNNYIDNIIEYGACAIDVETDGLDNFSDKIAGICLYSPNNNFPVYIPVNHINYISREKVEPQLDKEIVKSAVQKLIDSNVKFVLFNAKFDHKVLKIQWGLHLPIYRDGYIAQRCLDENNVGNGLKALHTKFVKQSSAVSFSYDKLFDGLPSSIIPLNEFALYAANDALITWELIEWQEQFFSKSILGDSNNHLHGVAKHYLEIEIPLLEVIADIEIRGIAINEVRRLELVDKYLPLLKEEETKFYKACEKYKDKIEAYKRKMNANNVHHGLDNPINLNSTEQLTILLYDILDIEPPWTQNNEKQWGKWKNTKKSTLEKLDHPLAEVILNYRKFRKLVEDFVINFTKYINPVTGKLHTSLNQYGTRTGRFSSSEPNLKLWAV